MLKIDIDKILPSNALIYLLTFVPGFFLQIAVAVARPDLASRIVAALEGMNAVVSYAGPLALLLIAFVTGATFISFVFVIQRSVVGNAWRLWFYLKPRICKHVFLPVLRRLLPAPRLDPGSPPPKPKWYWNWTGKLYRKTSDIVNPRPAGADPAFLWWAMLAKQLLKRRYGLDDVQLRATSLDPFRLVLTAPNRNEQWGDLMSVTLHATGWSALASLYFAPALRTSWFYIFIVFLIGIGLLNAIGVTRRWWNPMIGDLLRLRAVLREFPKLGTPAASESPKEKTEEG